MAKRKRDDEHINIEGYHGNDFYKQIEKDLAEEPGAFQPKVEVLSVADADSSRMLKFDFFLLS